MHGNALSTWRVRIRRRASLRTRRRLRFGRSWTRSATPARSARRNSPQAMLGSLSAAEALFHTLTGVADLLDGLLHRRCRPAGLLRLIANFVVLPAGHPGPVLLPS